MTSRERVRRTVRFEGVDRAPRDLWILPAASAKLDPAAFKAFQERFPGDFCQNVAGRCKPLRARGHATEIGEYTDEWGCMFENISYGIMGEVKQPLLDDYAKLDDAVQPPTELLTVDPVATRDYYQKTDKFTFASGWARTFERMQFIRGTENLMYDIAEDSPGFHELLKRVHGFYRAQFEVWAKHDVDGLVIMDDWGSQRSLLIHPEQWRRIFKPIYAEYGAIARGSGKLLFMHSDGCIVDIYEDLIDCGVNCINSQLFCMNIEEIGQRFAGRLAFWGEIDRQHVIPFGSVADCRAAVRRVHKNLWRNGGCVAQFELVPGAPLANAEAIYEEWDKLTAT